MAGMSGLSGMAKGVGDKIMASLPEKVRNTVSIRAFAFLKIPLLFYVSPVVDRLDETGCVVRIAPGTVIEDRGGDGVIHVRASGVTLRFAPGSRLRGAPEGTPWDALRGVGIRIDGARDVRIEDARLHGFRVGLLATAADGLTIDGVEATDNFRQRLRSFAVDMRISTRRACSVSNAKRVNVCTASVM